MWCKNQVLAALWPDRKLNTLELKTLEDQLGVINQLDPIIIAR